MAPVAVMLNLRADALTAAYGGNNQRGRPTTGSKIAYCAGWLRRVGGCVGGWVHPPTHPPTHTPPHTPTHTHTHPHTPTHTHTHPHTPTHTHTHPHTPTHTHPHPPTPTHTHPHPPTHTHTHPHTHTHTHTPTDRRQKHNRGDGGGGTSHSARSSHCTVRQASHGSPIYVAMHCRYCTETKTLGKHLNSSADFFQLGGL